MEFVKPGEQNNNEQHEIDTTVSQGQPSGNRSHSAACAAHARERGR